MAKFPTYEEMAKNIAEKALDEFLYDGKSIREWLQIIASEDCISRQEVLDILKDKWNMFSDANDAMQESIDTIEALPPVTPQSKMGQWIPLEYDGYADGNPVWDKWECSECGWEHSSDEESLTAFCPNCGARMVEPEESENKE